MDEVELVDYDPRWPHLFDEEAKRLRAVLDPSLIVGLEHFASTAVPDLSAKPIIDITSRRRAAHIGRQPAFEGVRQRAWNRTRSLVMMVHGLLTVAA
jgi:GrpB-like predicted nucleotidyltransferase (UPF0157 family)